MPYGRVTHYEEGGTQHHVSQFHNQGGKIVSTRSVSPVPPAWVILYFLGQLQHQPGAAGGLLEHAPKTYISPCTLAFLTTSFVKVNQAVFLVRYSCFCVDPDVGGFTLKLFTGQALLLILSLAAFSITIWIRFDLDFWEWCLGKAKLIIYLNLIDYNYKSVLTPWSRNRLVHLLEGDLRGDGGHGVQGRAAAGWGGGCLVREHQPTFPSSLPSHCHVHLAPYQEQTQTVRIIWRKVSKTSLDKISLAEL